jgi:glucokinase
MPQNAPHPNPAHGHLSPGSMTTAFDSPRLLADIGGTYARFALEAAPGQFAHAASLRCAEHADFFAAITAYLQGLPPEPAVTIEHAAIAIANPVEGDHVRMTNYHWQFSIEEMRSRLGLATLVVVNDFTALAMALPRLAPAGRRQVGGGTARERSVVGVLGAGTGLGVSGLIPADDGWVALGAEGGHVSFGPRNERELAIWRFAQERYGHVSFERLLSGPGIELIHEALTAPAASTSAPSKSFASSSAKRKPTTKLSAPEITQRGLAGTDATCAATLEVFCTMLGTAASNLAVTLGALGGIYIGGGIVPRLGPWFDRSGFRARFEDKGRFSDYLRGIPTYVVTAEGATFTGLSAILGAQLRVQEARQGSGSSAILGQIRRSLPSFSPAERRVAEHVLAHAHSVLSDAIATIARAADVSQPTVIRFCRSLGCEGLSDFKLRLASGLAGTVPVTHTQVTGDDSTLELGVKVLGNTASAVLKLREQLNRDQLSLAIDLLSSARRIEFYAIGHYGVVANDAQYKFLRFGMPSAAVVEPRLQRLAANVLAEGDVAVVISSAGQLEELLAVADIARARGAKVLALTAGNSPLARRADIALIVDHVEDLATHVPMVSRILHLLVIDILAVGVAMQRGDRVAPPLPVAVPDIADEARAPAAAPAGASGGARRVAPGISTAVPLARLTSHSR